MERHKQILFKRFTLKSMTGLDNLVSFAIQSEPKVRASYSESIKHSNKELVKLILVDGGFIIELFRMFCERDGIGTDAKLSQTWIQGTIYCDLLLLENQLPFFFLEDLYNRAFPVKLPGSKSFLELTYDFFNNVNMQKIKPNPDFKIKHFTDLLRFFHLPEKKHSRDPPKKTRDHVLLYSAEELQESGVKFKESTSKCLLGFKFSEPVLWVPHILVDDTTEMLFRNMIALEQCHYPYQSYIIDYALVLDCLINTNKDVDVLIQRKILHNYLGDADDVARVYNGLWRNVVHNNFNSEYLDICKRLNGFYQNPWRKKKATLMRDYFKTPWQGLVSAAGIVLLIFSLVQTICSILQVVLQ